MRNTRRALIKSVGAIGSFAIRKQFFVTRRGQKGDISRRLDKINADSIIVGTIKERSAKPLCAGSIPARASNPPQKIIERS